MNKKTAAAYEYLGLAIDAPHELVATTCKRLLMQYHPDREGGDTEKFHEVLKARDLVIKKTCPLCGDTGVIRTKLGSMTQTKPCGRCT